MTTFQIALGTLVAFMWAGTLIADVALESFTAPDQTGLMLAVVVGAFAKPIVSAIRKNGNGTNGA